MKLKLNKLTMNIVTWRIFKEKKEVIHSIEQQGMLTDELKSDILKQTKLQRVEDLYRPYKQKRKRVQLKLKEKDLNL